MIHRRTQRFKRAFEALHPDQKRQAIEAFKKFREDPWHPSLRIEKLEGRKGVWAGHISYHFVWTFEYSEDPETGEIICSHRVIGPHDEVYRDP